MEKYFSKAVMLKCTTIFCLLFVFPILSMFAGMDATHKQYKKQDIERDLKNKKLKNTDISRQKIQASTKTDKRSLPYNNVIVSRLMLETDVSAMFDSKRIYRKIISELLTKDIYRIRFYIHIETYEDNSNMMAKILGMCGLKYCFRYYVP